jgi:hypothetical protein
VFDVITLDRSLAELVGMFRNEGVPFKTRLSRSSAVVPAGLNGAVWLDWAVDFSEGSERNEGVGRGHVEAEPISGGGDAGSG